MASPQLEGGYTKIANELYDAIIKWRLSSYEYRVLIFIIRKTFGWNKKEDWISLSQFVEGTNIQRSHICRALRMLREQNIITKRGNRENPLYSIQKDYEKWLKLAVGERSHHITKGGNIKKGVIASAKGGNKVVPKGAHTKETIQKTLLQKKPASQSDAGLISKIISLFEGINPSYGRWYGNTTQRGSIDRLLVANGFDKLQKVIALLPKTNGMRYFPTITTPSQLEDKWAQLETALIRKKGEQTTRGRGFVT